MNSVIIIYWWFDQSWCISKRLKKNYQENLFIFQGREEKLPKVFDQLQELSSRSRCRLFYSQSRHSFLQWYGNSRKHLLNGIRQLEIVCKYKKPIIKIHFKCTKAIAKAVKKILINSHECIGSTSNNVTHRLQLL